MEEKKGEEKRERDINEELKQLEETLGKITKKRERGFCLSNC